MEKEKTRGTDDVLLILLPVESTVRKRLYSREVRLVAVDGRFLMRRLSPAEGRSRQQQQQQQGTDQGNRAVHVKSIKELLGFGGPRAPVYIPESINQVCKLAACYIYRAVLTTRIYSFVIFWKSKKKKRRTASQHQIGLYNIKVR